MRLSYQWLAEMVDLKGTTPEQLATLLTGAGLAVDAVEPRTGGVSGVIVGLVQACVPHPNADRLRVCTVDVGQQDLLTIVCGAPNAAAGMKVPVAVVGAELPGGKIGKAKLRGVESMGMLCSAREIGLETKWLPKEQTEGLYVLPSDAAVGADVVQLLSLDDVILEIDLTPNRADCLSIRGLAYEVAALLNVPFALDVPAGPKADGPSPATVRIESPNCTRYDAQVLADVGQGPSPLWMQMRLLAMGVRPISLAVDVTNYVMLEWGQPLHAFDFDQVHDGTIVVRQAAPGETLVTLDGEERTLTADNLVIADVDRAIGIAGVMGGENSEITPGTRRVVLESAAFGATSVRRTGAQLGLRSEAQQRFEKGIDPVAVRAALNRAAALLCELSGARPVGERVSAVNASAEAEPVRIPFSPARCNGLLGTEIPEAEMQEIFRRLGLTVETAGERWQVQAPSRRPDLAVEADLVEEIGRMHGLDSIPSTLPHTATTVGMRTDSQWLRQKSRQVWIDAGSNEVFTYTFTHPKRLDALRIPNDSPYRLMIPLMRPMSDERTVLRTHMLPGLAAVAAYNQAHGVSGGQIFEIGSVYWPSSLPLVEQPCERLQLAALWFGQTDGAIGTRPRNYDFYDAKGVVETWLQSLGLLASAAFQPIRQSWLHPGRSAEVLIGDVRIGTIGEIHPETVQALETGPALYAEFDLETLLGQLAGQWKVSRLPRYPAIRRDLAVLVRDEVPAGALLAAVREACEQYAPNLLESVHVFDVYAGKGIPDGQKSVALALSFRHEERTLTDEEVDAAVAAILQALAESHGAVLRG